MKLFALLSLKNKTSADCEGYKIYLNNRINPAVCTYLARLFDRCLEGQYFPWILKFVLVSRLFKSGKKHNSGNYRSVSLLPVISKVLKNLSVAEWEVLYYRKNFWRPINLNHNKKKLTVEAVLDVIETISKSLSAKKDVACTFIDLYMRK